MFKFNPEDGLLNTVEFPDKPTSSTVARNQFMKLFNQIKDYINGMETNGVKANGGNADTLGGKNADSFASASHSHSSYSTTSHNHDGKYASSSHSHSSYSTTSHNHDGKYANTSHGHDRVNNSNWADNSGKINGKKVFIQQSRPTASSTGDIWISW